MNTNTSTNSLSVSLPPNATILDKIDKIDKKIILKYTQINLDNDEFPPLNKYEFEEEYEEEIYKFEFGKIIKNKYESYIELTKMSDIHNLII